MRSKALKKTVSMFLTGIMFTAAVPAASMINSDALQIPDKKGEYDYELWSERDSDSVSMTNGENGTFSCSWNNAHNCLFRAGKLSRPAVQTVIQRYEKPSGVFDCMSGSPGYFNFRRSIKRGRRCIPQKKWG